MANLIPSIGARGLFRLQSPFDTKLLSGVAYTCKAVRRLQDFLVSDEDPKKDYYDANGLSDSIWTRDSLDPEVCIVSLVTDANQWVRVPSSFILAFPNVNGVPYTVRGLGINLGAIPDSLDLTNLYNVLKDLVRDTIGIDTIVQSIALSETDLLSQSEHETLEIARQSLITSSETERARLIEAQNTIQQLREQVTALEDYIVSNS